MPTIHDVAREAQVAASTVSLVINNSGRVAQRTRERVKRAIRDVGYTRRRKSAAYGGRRLSLAFLYTLEAVVGEDVGPYCREVAAGINHQGGRAGAAISVFRGAAHAAADPIIDDLLKQRPFDGVILFGHEQSNGYLDRVLEANVPLVVFNEMPQQTQFSCVNVDFYGGTAQAIEHLVALGHRRIARIKNPAYTKSIITQQRRDSTLQTLARHNLEPLHIHLNPNAGDVPEQIAAACREVLNAHATAVHCSERLAIQLANQFEQWGVRVPEDISIVGFDNIGFRTDRDQQLTSVGYDRHYMGRLAVRMLKHMVLTRDKVRWCHAVTVPTRLVEGETAAAPPADAPALSEARS